jgi:hypothetical protein
MHRKLPALAVLAVAAVLPAQAVAAPTPSTTASSGGAIAQQEPAAPQEVAGESAQLTASGLAIAPASAPQEVKDIIAAGNKIAKKPYVYGGGHARLVDTGYDCSGSVSYALIKAGLLTSSLDSSGFMRWGERGRGTWVTIRSNPGHAYMIVAGLRFDTSARSVTGSRWTDEMRSAKGYRGTHPEGF